MFTLPKPEILAKSVQPDAAIAFWQARAAMTREQAMALEQGARGRAFYVAGLAQHDMIETVKDAIGEALASGETVAGFKKRIGGVIEAAGWKGHRVDNIFRTNMQTAYAAGRYAKMQAVKATRPYWQYITVEDRRRRPSHAVLHELVYHADHEFWGTHYPPNGFRCRCCVRTLSERQMKREGLSAQTAMPSDMLYIDPVTGMEYPVAMPGADKGFRGNAGKDWMAGLAPQEVGFDAGTDLVSSALCLLAQSGDFADPHYRQIGHGKECLPPLAGLALKHVLPVKPSDLLPANLSPEEYALAFLREFGLKSLNDSTLFTLPFLRTPLLISQALVLNKEDNILKAAKFDRGPFMKLMASVIKNPFEVWQVPMQLSGKTHITLRFLRLFREEGSKDFSGYAAFNWVGGGRFWSGATAFKPSGKGGATVNYVEKQRNGVLLFREDGGGVLQK